MVEVQDSVLLQGKLSIMYTSHKHLVSLTFQTLLGRLFELTRARQDKQDPCNKDLGLRIYTSSFPPHPLNSFTGKL